MTARNEIALNPKAADGPSVASTTPARAGPNARAAVNCMELTRTALRSTGRGTSWGTNACQAAVVMPEPRPEITTRPRMIGVVAPPGPHVPHSGVAIDTTTPGAQISTV